jgi:hypothetical protein
VKLIQSSSPGRQPLRSTQQRGLAMEVSWLRPEMAERFGPDNAAWPTRVGTKPGISTATVVERWAAGFNSYLILRTRPASYSRTFTSEPSPCRRAAAVRVSVTRTLTHLLLTAA